LERRLRLRTPAFPGWSIDSRTVNPGDCFFALRGPARDGHAYVGQAAEKGAAVAVVEQAVVEQAGASEIPQLVVEDTLIALQELAAWERARWAGRWLELPEAQERPQPKTPSLPCWPPLSKPGVPSAITTTISACRFRSCGCRTIAGLP